MKINTSRKAGFTLVEIMIVVAIIGLLAAIAIPNFVNARQTSQINACINNLRQIDSAKQQYALENGLPANGTVTAADVLIYIGRTGVGTAGSDVCCPLISPKTALGNYSATLNAVNVLPTCAGFAAATHWASLDPAIAVRPGAGS